MVVVVGDVVGVWQLGTGGMEEGPEQVSAEPAAGWETATLREIVVEAREQEEGGPKKKSTACSSQASPQRAAVPPALR